MWIEIFQRCGSLRIMDETQFRAELGFFESLRTEILKILQSRQKWKPLTRRLEEEDLFVKTAEKLWERYNQVYSRINDLLGFDPYKGLQYVNRPNNGDFNDWFATLSVLLLECDKAIEGLKSKIFPLTGKQSITLKRLEGKVLEEGNFKQLRDQVMGLNLPPSWGNPIVDLPRIEKAIDRKMASVVAPREFPDLGFWYYNKHDTDHIKRVIGYLCEVLEERRYRPKVCVKLLAIKLLGLILLNN